MPPTNAFLFASLSSWQRNSASNTPKVVDVARRLIVIGEGIEGRVEVVEYGDTLESVGWLALTPNNLGDAGDDLLSGFASVMPLLKRSKTVNGSMS